MTEHITRTEHMRRSRLQYDRDRAVIARIGGSLITKHTGTLATWTPETLAFAVQAIVNNRKASRRAALPEAAFDWPIYAAATGAYGTLKAAEVEALHRYGQSKFDDAWWPGRSKDDHSPEDAALLDDMGYFESEDQA